MGGLAKDTAEQLEDAKNQVTQKKIVRLVKLAVPSPSTHVFQTRSGDSELEDIVESTVYFNNAQLDRLAHMLRRNNI